MPPSNSFAGFFPAAPSVQQQKRKRAATEREKLDAAASSLSNGATAVHDLDSPATLSHNAKRQRLSSDNAREDATVVNGDSGDLLNGVGSASSHKSTSSSIFSQNGHTAASLRDRSNNASYEQTPLTVPESSPGGRFTPRSSKTPNVGPLTDPGNPAAGSAEPIMSDAPSQATVPTAVERPRVRPSEGEYKGERAVYDPELDRKLTSKERKNPQLKIRYLKFGDKVRQTPLHYIQNWAARVARADYLTTRKPRHPQIRDWRFLHIEMAISNQISNSLSRCGSPSPGKLPTL